VEYALFPEMKGCNLVSLLGLTAAVVGELIRKAGMITAGSSFTHQIRHHRDDSHRLITGGIYR
jgi:protein-S-isoprenylcysteine O-methyltransferase